MGAPTLRVWASEFMSQFDNRALDYMRVHKGTINLQIKDPETGEIHLHRLNFVSKDAENLKIKEV